MINKKLPYKSQKFEIKILKNDLEVKNPLNVSLPLEEKIFSS